MDEMAEAYRVQRETAEGYRRDSGQGSNPRMSHNSEDFSSSTLGIGQTFVDEKVLRPELRMWQKQSTLSLFQRRA
jgi:hypothetical protein